MNSYRTERHVHIETESRIIDFRIGDRVEWQNSEGVKLKGTIMKFNPPSEGEILAIIKPDILGTYGMARPLSILHRVEDGTRLGEWAEH